MDENRPLIHLNRLSAEEALNREWLCTNGLGSYAMGSLAGANTRRYHGLLVAALAPPLGRHVLCAKADETFITAGGSVATLGANEFHDGTRAPWGIPHLHSFHLEGSRPVWVYSVRGGTLEKAVWMEQGQTTTYLRYRAIGTGGNLRLALFATYRDYHHETCGSVDWRMQVTPLASGAEITAFTNAVPWRVLGPRGARFHPAGEWWWRFRHRRELERGLDCEEDLYLVGHLELPLSPGEASIVALTTEAEADVCLSEAWERRQARERTLIRLAGAEEDPARAQLVLAADQFLVARGDSPAGEAGTILAGYPWFSDWGRDTMIALPGLTLSTGRYPEARRILLTYARYLDRGMLPNRFPDSNETPEYNTVDATLWWFQATAAALDASGDLTLLEEILPALDEAIAWHLCGTRYGIRVDPDDGLLQAGEEGTQLTWMDAKVGDWVVTPRRGKPVEINALWINALLHMDAWTRRLGRPPCPRGLYAASYADLAAKALDSFGARFWNAAGGYLYDLIDPSGTPDPALRPNQLFALSLAHPLLNRAQARGVVHSVARALLVPIGLRTLSPDHPDYQGRYAGDQWQRDSAYHRGTAWAWPIGAFAAARRRIGGSEAQIRTLCRPLTAHLAQAGVGSVSEVFDGDPPHTPGGCPAQAWSVAELLRVLTPTASRERG